jgi:anti-sigma regulatory factor (Ser/Thr protein kinase)
MTDAEKRDGYAVKAPAPTSLELSGQALPDLIPTFRHRACDFAAANSAAPKAVEAIALAVTEAVTNVLKHAYEPGASDRAICLRGSVADDLLEITVSDRGLGFRESAHPGLGVGLSIIASMSAELDIDQGPQGTELRMRFPL